MRSTGSAGAAGLRTAGGMLILDGMAPELEAKKLMLMIVPNKREFKVGVNIGYQSLPRYPEQRKKEY